MSLNSITLRKWQKQGLDVYSQHSSVNFLTVATPGAGKTTFALAIARLTMATLSGALVVVAPTKHLKYQWAAAAGKFGFNLEQDWDPAVKLLGDYHGVVVTYQQVASRPDKIEAIARDGFVILDEIHHVGDEMAWGDAVSQAFGTAARRLLLSGTPFRSDTAAIPFVTYEDGEAVADYEYGYQRALADRRVVRPVFFPATGGHMEWTDPAGNHQAASFDDFVSADLANQRLRAALSLEGEWLPTVLSEADRRLRQIRRTHFDAGGLIIAIDQEHARQISDWMAANLTCEPVVAVSEDPKASEKIARFAGNDRDSHRWLVAVKMVSEGVDIPRLRIGVYATTTTTELFFRQAVGRLVRHIPGRGTQKAFMFIPDDFRLRRYGAEIAATRRHNIKKSNDSPARLLGEGSLSGSGELVEQVSLFAVHSATAGEVPQSDLFAQLDMGDEHGQRDDPELVLDLTQLPVPGGVAPLSAPDGSGRSEVKRLRSVNQTLVKELSQTTGQTPAEINARLNTHVGIRTIAEATRRQLESRIKIAEKWLRKPTR